MASLGISPLANPADDAEPPSKEIVITGSRIPVAASSVTTGPLRIITQQDILLEGAPDTVDLLNSLPQTTLSAGNDYGNHSSPNQTVGGIATADLRGLGPQRTLVLVNGRRLGIGDPSTGNPNPAPDLDQIPMAVVERVEVASGGASSTYGSDAVAGVVNFILKKHIEGVQIDAQYGFAHHNEHAVGIEEQQLAQGITPPTGSIVDGGRRDLSVLAGTGFAGGAGSLGGYFAYHRMDPVRGADRDFASCQAASNNYLSGVSTDTGVRCLGSRDSNRFVTDAGSGAAYAVVGNTFVPWPAAGSIPPARFDSAQYQYLQRQDTRYQAGLLADLSMSEGTSAYLELSYMDDGTRTQIAPSGLFQGSNATTSDGTYRVNCSNPLLSAQEAAILCTPAQIAADAAAPGSVSADLDIGRRNIEGGGRASTYEHLSYRAVAGIEGHVGEVWSYDAYGLYHYTSLFHSNLSYLGLAAIDNALEVTTNSAGQPVCISGSPCVPYNIFSTGAVTPAQLSHLYTPGTDHGANSEVTVHADATSRLGRYGIATPWAADGLAVNAGLEHRVDALRFAPDAAELSGDLSGYGGPAVALGERIAVDEGFIEARLPVARELPGVHNLMLAVGYRYSHYSTAAEANTYKLELQYAPVPDLRLRSSLDRVVRAPNIIELYTPLVYSPSFTVGSDPCAPTDHGASHAQASLAQCLHTGVTAAQYGDGFGPAVGGTSTIPQCLDAGCGSVLGGNKHLAPESAQTFSLGLTLTPSQLPGLTASIDYYHIRLEHQIGTVPGSITLQRCLDSGDPQACSQIVRTADGSLSGVALAGSGYILQWDVNTGSALVSGIDVEASYHFNFTRGLGTLDLTLDGTRLLHNTVTPYAGAPGYDCAGLFGGTCLNGSVNPLWRHTLRLDWQLGKLLLSARWRFIGPASFDNNSGQALLANQEEGFYDPLVRRIPGYHYLDLAALWTLRQGLTLRGGMSNVLDRDPPFIPAEISQAAGSINTFPTYDLMGREVFLGLRASF
jgi:outer membrane receptor protein involved in Fe transport